MLRVPIRRCVRLQSLTTLRLAGQWLEDPPLSGETRPHCMRVMLVANTDVEHAHANGATGRLVGWSQEVDVDGTCVRSVQASDAGVQARFHHEASYQSSTQYFLPNVDFVDVEPRKEVVASARGKPSTLQLAFKLAYCSTRR